MRKIYRLLICVIALCLFIGIGYAAATDDGEMYIVRLDDSAVSLFGGVDKTDYGFEMMTRKELDACIEAGIVESYEKDVKVSLCGEIVSVASTEESQSSSPTNWQYEMVNYSHPAKLSCVGYGVRVAVIDSGVTSLTALPSGTVAEGYNYLTETTDVTDSIGHGTFVSGVIASNSKNAFLRGLAPETVIVPLKCFNSVSTDAGYVAKAVQDAVDKYDCDIINLSLGSAEQSDVLEEKIQYAIDNGVIVVSAVGNYSKNNGDDVIHYPAGYDGVIGVGSVDKTGTVSSFSHKNSSVMLVAPGEEVYGLSHQGDSYYVTANGTSFSTPLVSAAAAALLSADNTLTREEITEILKTTASRTDGVEYDHTYGYGLLDCESALEKALFDVPFFVSRIKTVDGTFEATVYNNTDTQREAVVVAGEYDNDKLGRLQYLNLTLDAEATSDISFSSYDSGKLMFFNDFENLEPIIGYRKIGNAEITASSESDEYITVAESVPESYTSDVTVLLASEGITELNEETSGKILYINQFGADEVTEGLSLPVSVQRLNEVYGNGGYHEERACLTIGGMSVDEAMDKNVYLYDPTVKMLDTKNLILYNMEPTVNDGNTTYRVGMFAGIDSLNYRSVGYEVVCTDDGASKTTNSKTVYDSVSYTRNGTDVTRYASDFGDNCMYLFGSVMGFSEKYKLSNFRFRPYAVDMQGNTIYGKYAEISGVYTK